jgi:hypothetical protein
VSNGEDEGEEPRDINVPDFITKIRSSHLFAQTLVALVTVMHSSEVLALRDRYADLDKKVIYVREVPAS